MRENGLSALLSQSPKTLSQSLGSPARAKAVYRSLRKGKNPFRDEELPAGLRARLLENFTDSTPRILSALRADDGTEKFLIELEDLQKIECVLIPAQNRTTLCVSTQVGCIRGCQFCLTATMGLIRNLKSSEILDQVFFGLKRAAELEPPLPHLRNLVFMGMGEPLDNFDALKDALSTLTAHEAFAFAPRHCTVSTVGPSPKAILKTAELPAQMAWSLHAADESLRKRLIPTQRHSPALLRDAFAEVCAKTKRALFVEITLIDGLNDREEHAEDLRKFFENFPTEVRFNLLPMNPIGSAMNGSSAERAEAFARVLALDSHVVRRRRARGAHQRSACGQLAVL